MAIRPSVQSIYHQYSQEQTELQSRLAKIEEERVRLEQRLLEVQALAEAASVLLAGKDLERKTGRPAKSLPAHKPAPAAAPPASGRRARKGRRRVSTEAVSIHDMGIVDAALELARQKGKSEFTAGHVLEWFEEVGFKTRKGTPSRNSIYVSLNREFTEGTKRGTNRVDRVGRGDFILK